MLPRLSFTNQIILSEASSYDKAKINIHPLSPTTMNQKKSDHKIQPYIEEKNQQSF